MANFCINCGTRVGKDDNFCTNCGARIDKSDIKHNNHLFKSSPDTMEKKKAKEELKRVTGGGLLSSRTFNNTLVHNGLDVISDGRAIKQQVTKEIESGQIKSGGVEFRVNQLIVEYKNRMEKEKEEQKKKLKMIDEIFESQEIKSEIRKNKNDQMQVISIKDDLKDKVINKKENMSADEIRYFIKSELKKARKEPEKTISVKENASKKIERNDIDGGYCSYSCIHCYEQYIDSGGGIDFDFAAGEIVDYYCTLGHSLVFGSFCEDYQQ